MRHMVRLQEYVSKLDFSASRKGKKKNDIMSVDQRQRYNTKMSKRCEARMWKCKTHSDLTLFYYSLLRKHAC